MLLFHSLSGTGRLFLGHSCLSREGPATPTCGKCGAGCRGGEAGRRAQCAVGRLGGRGSSAHVDPSCCAGSRESPRASRFRRCAATENSLASWIPDLSPFLPFAQPHSHKLQARARLGSSNPRTPPPPAPARRRYLLERVRVPGPLRGGGSRGSRMPISKDHLVASSTSLSAGHS